MKSKKNTEKDPIPSEIRKAWRPTIEDELASIKPSIEIIESAIRKLSLSVSCLKKTVTGIENNLREEKKRIKKRKGKK